MQKNIKSEITMKNKGHVITRIVPGSIAEELELEAGDIVLKIDDQWLEDVFNAHVGQLFETHCAVERFSLGSLVLAALVQERHDDGDTLCRSNGSTDDTLQILKMIVGRHMVRMSADGIGHAVVGDIGDQEQIRATNRL